MLIKNTQKPLPDKYTQSSEGGNQCGWGKCICGKVSSLSNSHCNRANFVSVMPVSLCKCALSGYVNVNGVSGCSIYNNVIKKNTKPTRVCLKHKQRAQCFWVWLVEETEKIEKLNNSLEIRPAHHNHSFR